MSDPKTCNAPKVIARMLRTAAIVDPAHSLLFNAAADLLAAPAALVETKPFSAKDNLRESCSADKAEVSIVPIALSDGRTDYFVQIKVGDRAVTPHVFREEHKSAYHVALYDWLLNGNGEEPDCVEFGSDDWPGRVMRAEPQGAVKWSLSPRRSDQFGFIDEGGKFRVIGELFASGRQPRKGRRGVDQFYTDDDKAIIRFLLDALNASALSRPERNSGR